jgi:6-bladed beta-propeller
LQWTGCTSRSQEETALAIRQDTIGDTVVVETLAGSVWGETRTLIPELAIGREDGDPESLLGAPSNVALLPHGAIAVLDVIGPRLLVFDRDGRFLRSVGRVGQGPGEYERLTGLVGFSGGLMAVHEGFQNKVMVFDTLGALVVQWSTHSRPFLASNSLSTDEGGHIVLRCAVPTPDVSILTSQQIGVVRFTRDGDFVDSTVAPLVESERVISTDFYPQRFGYWHPAGFMVAGTNEDYTLDLLRSDGPVNRIRRAWEPVPLASEEWEIWDEIRRFMERRWGGRKFPDVPKEKPPFSRVIIARTGELWVQRHTAAIRLGRRPPDIMAAGGSAQSPWQEPLLVDVFSPDGRFMGSVTGRTRTELFAISSDTVWAGLPGATGEPLLVRFRVRVGPQAN